MNFRLRCRRGITLIEILAALAIFAMVIIGMGRVLASLMESAVRVERETHLRIQMENHLSMVRKDRLQPMVIREKPDAYGISYTIEVRPHDVRNDNGQPLSGFYLISVQASWTGLFGAPGEDRIEVLVYQP